MSDLDRTVASGSNPQNIDIRGASRQAVGKLHSLAGGSGVAAGRDILGGDASQLVGDAFAEIFAIVANSRIEHDGASTETDQPQEVDASQSANEPSSTSDEAREDPRQRAHVEESNEATTEPLLEAGSFVVQADENSQVTTYTEQEAHVDELTIEQTPDESALAPLVIIEAETTSQSPITLDENPLEGDSQEESDAKTLVPAATDLDAGESLEEGLAVQPVVTGANSVEDDAGASRSNDAATTEGVGIFVDDSGERDGRRDSSRRSFGLSDANRPAQEPAIEQTNVDQNSASADAATAGPRPSGQTETNVSRNLTDATFAASATNKVAASTSASATTTTGSRANGSGTSPANPSAGNLNSLADDNPAAQSNTGTSRSAGKKSAEPASNRTDTVNRIKLIQRVSKAFQHLGPDGGVVRLRLAPAELGSVRLEMRIHQKQVNARVVTETEAAQSSLREHLGDLRGRLEALGMKVESLEVTTEQAGDEAGKHGQDFAGQFTDQDPQQQRARSPLPNPSRRGAAGARTEDTEASTAAEQSIPSLVGAAQWSPELGVDLQV